MTAGKRLLQVKAFCVEYFSIKEIQKKENNRLGCLKDILIKAFDNHDLEIIIDTDLVITIDNDLQHDH